MSSLKNVYDPERAAQFLGITLEELDKLTQQGDLTIRSHQRRNFYLGGELDSVKINVNERLGKPNPTPNLPRMGDQFFQGDPSCRHSGQKEKTSRAIRAIQTQLQEN